MNILLSQYKAIHNLSNDEVNDYVISLFKQVTDKTSLIQIIDRETKKLKEITSSRARESLVSMNKYDGHYFIYKYNQDGVFYVFKFDASEKNIKYDNYKQYFYDQKNAMYYNDTCGDVDILDVSIRYDSFNKLIEITESEFNNISIMFNAHYEAYNNIEKYFGQYLD